MRFDRTDWRTAGKRPRGAECLPWSWRALCALALLPILVAGCGALLPKTKKDVRSPWENFDAAKRAYDRVLPLQTTDGELKALGFDPYSVPNVKILSYLDLTQRFMPNNAIQLEDLDPSVRGCLEAKTACHGYEVRPEHVRSKRTGNFWLDFFNFKRRTEETGWNFQALFVLQDGRVVHKLWSGTPVLDQREERVNPLGPLQNSGDLVKGSIRVQ